MSQIFKSSASSPSPPAVATSYVTDSGTAVPVANVLNITTPGGGTQGVATSASGNTITVTVTPSDITGTVTTTDATVTTCLSVALGAVGSVYTIESSVAGFSTVGVGTPAGCGFAIVGSIRTDGATATLISGQSVDHFEEASLVGVSSTLSVSGNNMIITVKGLAAYNIRWKAILNYIFVV